MDVVAKRSLCVNQCPYPQGLYTQYISHDTQGGNKNKQYFFYPYAEKTVVNAPTVKTANCNILNVLFRQFNHFHIYLIEKVLI